MKKTLRNLGDTRDFAENIVRRLSPGEQATILALIGDLGSGKTTFSQFVGDALGVRDPIQSPTFLIEKIYELHKRPWSHLIHIDAYRLEFPGELISLGWKEIIRKPENLILVEWANKVESILPESSIKINFKFIDETTREVEILDA